MKDVLSLINQKLEAMAEAGDPIPIISKRGAICTLLPYATFLLLVGQPRMAKAIIRAALVSKSYWFLDPVGSYITTLFGEPTSLLNCFIIVASPHINWEGREDGEKMVVGWAAAVSAVGREVGGQSVVDTLLQIASVRSLRPHLPIGIWGWLKDPPSLPPVCLGRRCGTTPDTVRHVRRLGDFKILKSYLLLVWSEWDDLCIDGLDEMEITIREEFNGIGMRGHREDLLKRLDYVLERLGLGLGYLEQHNPQVKQYRIKAAQGQYGKLKGVLLDVDWNQ